jgi:Fe-S-cluster-containing hydrogenase component 2
VNQRRHCLACLHCAAACPVRAITWEGLSQQALYPPLPEDPVERAVAFRRSTRRFRPDCPEKALLQRVLDRAEYAPSSKNEHKNAWTVVLGRDKTDALLPDVLDWGAANGRRELKIQM